jgi:hypothetical protein
MKKNTLIQIAGLAGGATVVGEAAYAYAHRNEPRRKVSLRQARKTGDELAVDWNRIDPDELRQGMEVELEHGRRDPVTDVTGDDLLLTGKIALAHLNEFPDYYERLARMEDEARRFWNGGIAGEEMMEPGAPWPVHPHSPSVPERTAIPIS